MRLLPGSAACVLLALLAGSPALALIEPDLARCRSELFGKGSGLPSTEVRALAETENGDVLIATSEGLARWSGGKMVGQPHSAEFDRVKLVVAMAHDSLGTIWMAPAKGQPLCLRSGALEECLKPDDRLRDDWPVVDLAGEAKGKVWFAISDVVYLFQNGELSWTSNYPREQAGPIRRIEPAGDRVWIGAERGLFVRSATGDFEARQIPGLGSLASVSALAATPDGALLAGGLGLLVRIGKDGTTQVLRERDGLPGAEITSILQDRDGHVWAASKAGLIRWSPGEPTAVRRYTKATSSLIDDDVTALLEDRTGGLWIGTRTSGLQWLTDRPEESFLARAWPYGIALLGLGIVFSLLASRRRLRTA